MFTCIVGGYDVRILYELVCFNHISIELICVVYEGAIYIYIGLRSSVFGCNIIYIYILILWLITVQAHR